MDKRIRLSHHTDNDYQLNFDRLLTFLGNDTPIGDITADDLRHFLADVKAKRMLGAKSLINVWIAPSSLWKWVEKELEIPHVTRRYKIP
ncbi:MAG: site-specific integrase [Caldilineaceae bacterium]